METFIIFLIYSMTNIYISSENHEIWLTDLEVHTLFLHANGLDIKKIADKEGVSESAIKQRFRNLRHKLQARNNTHAVMRAFQKKIFAIVDIQKDADAHPDMTFMF